MLLDQWCPKCSGKRLRLAWRRKISNRQFAWHRVCDGCKRRWVFRRALDDPFDVLKLTEAPPAGAKEQRSLFTKVNERA